MSNPLSDFTSLLSMLMLYVAMSPVLLSAILSALTSSSVRPSHHAMCSSGISSQPSILHAATRVWPQTIVGSSRDLRTICPRKPNALMDSATAGTALSLRRALRSYGLISEIFTVYRPQYTVSAGYDVYPTASGR